MNQRCQLKLATVIRMAWVIMCVCPSPTFAQQPPVGAVVQSLPRDASGAYLLSTPRGVPISTIDLTATDPDPCDIVGFYARAGYPMPPGIIVTDHGVANPSCTPGIVFTGTISGTPTEQGTFTSVVQADGANALVSFVWTVTNTTPTIDVIGDQTFVAGQPIAIAVGASDANGDGLIFSATNLPVGLIVNPWSGVISGTSAVTGPFAPVITVDDGHGGSASRSFTLTTTGTGTTPSCVLDANGNRTPGVWCAGDLVLGLGTSRYGPVLDAEGHAVLDSDGNPIMTWTVARPGEFAIHDSRGTSHQSSVFDSSLDVTAACTVDPVSGQLWSSGASTNVISHIAAPTSTLGPQLLPPIDISSYTLTGACDGSAPPYEGCGAAESLVIDRQGHLYIGTVRGTNKILKFNQDGTFLTSYTVPLGPGGPGWIELAADQETMYYLSGDNTIRLFNVNGTPLPQALLDAGVEHLWDPVLDPANIGLFGKIVVKAYGNDPIATALLGVRVLPPGDGSGGLVVLYDTVVQRIDLAAHFILGFSPEDLSLRSFALTPDAKSVWTITNYGGHSGLVKSHLPTATTDRGPLRNDDSPLVNVLCVNNGYTAALTQPDCGTDSTNALCQPLPICPGGGQGPDCVPPRTPSIEQPSDRDNDEGDTIAPITIVASDPNDSPLTYTVDYLPQGLTFEPATHTIAGTIGWHASDVLGVPATHARVVVRNAEGFVAQKWFDWTVRDKNAPPSASVAPSLPRDASGAYLISTPRGVPLSLLALTATDPDPCDGVGFYVRPASPMPPGVMVTDDGVSPTCYPGVVFSGAIAGTPDTLGTFTSVVQANAATPLATFIWTVTNTAPTLDTVADRSVNAGAALSIAVNAADENHDALTFSAGGLPPGLVIDPSTGTVSGTTSAIGNHAVTVTVEDGNGESASTSFVIHITDGNCTALVTPTEHHDRRRRYLRCASGFSAVGMCRVGCHRCLVDSRREVWLRRRGSSRRSVGVLASRRVGGRCCRRQQRSRRRRRLCRHSHARRAGVDC
jgi:hypothetical protein